MILRMALVDSLQLLIPLGAVTLSDPLILQSSLSLLLQQSIALVLLAEQDKCQKERSSDELSPDMFGSM